MNPSLSLPSSLRVLALIGLLAPALVAAQMTIGSDINGPLDPGLPGPTGISSWSGSNPSLGFIGNGGYDAFDGYGYLRNLGPLTVQRQVDVLTGANAYRWLDVFTNPTGSAITRTVEFYGDLGADNRTRVESAAPGVLITSDRNGAVAANNYNDPVVAHISGLTSFAGGSISTGQIVNMNTWGNWADDYLLQITLTLAPGESIGILNFAALSRLEPRNFASDLSFATTFGNDLLANPIFTGLTPGQISTIRNFATPEPGVIALLLAGLGLLWWQRRRIAIAV